MLQQGLVLGNNPQTDCKRCMLLVQETVLFVLWFYKLHQIVRGLENFYADLFLCRQSIYFHPYDSKIGIYQIDDY